MRKEYSEEMIREQYQKITRLLIRQKRTITTMESATSGQIASLLTDTEGASAILKGAFVTYSNEAKIMQGVPKEVIDRYSVYSVQTAEAMALACKKAYQADIGIGITGTMGNVDPENEAFSTPGTVYFSVAAEEGMFTEKVEIPVQPTRLLYKLAAAARVAEVLLMVLEQMEN